MRTAFVLTVLSLSLVVGVPSAQARLSTEAALYESAAPNLGGPEAPRAHVIITEYRPRHWDIQQVRLHRRMDQHEPSAAQGHLRPRHG